MKEINVQNLPNYRNVIIPKKIKQIPLNELIYTAWQNIETKGERDIYLFFVTYPEDNVKIGFDSTIAEKMNLKIGSRHNGFKNLVEKGYLKKINEFDYCFIENPIFKMTNFIEYKNDRRDSKPIQKIKYLLNENNISFSSETVFSDCIFVDTGYFAFFDLFVNNEFIIEYDGEQHFKSIEHWNGKEGFEKRHQHDLIKNKYCFDNNIPIIRIPYDAEYTLNDLKLETTRFLLTPENEEEYYNLRGDKNEN